MYGISTGTTTGAAVGGLGAGAGIPSVFGGSGSGALTGGATALPFTGAPLDLVWLAMVAMLLISVGVMLTRTTRLVRAENTTGAGVFLR